MSERRVKVPLEGKSVDAIDVPIKETVERWTEIHLDDGVILRIKSTVLSVSRIEGKYDQEGNPVYAIKGGQVTAVASVPDHLRQPQGSIPKVQ